MPVVKAFISILSVSFFLLQMAVLLLFEKSDSLSYAELQDTTKLTDDQFPR